jgi:hypothetical protein
MSLEATHIRLALDLQDRLNISDRKKYISGTVYPDSRYISKIDRRFTHNPELVNELDGSDDFLKGMAVHYLCDKVALDIHKEWFYDLLDGEKEWEGKWWHARTAMKIIQDIRDFSKIDIESVLDDLDYVEVRFGESIEDVRKFNKAVQIMYRGVEIIGPEHAMKFWHTLGLDSERAKRVFAKTEEFLGIEKIYHVYDESLKRAKKLIFEKTKT